MLVFSISVLTPAIRLVQVKKVFSGRNVDPYTIGNAKKVLKVSSLVKVTYFHKPYSDRYWNLLKNFKMVECRSMKKL